MTKKDEKVVPVKKPAAKKAPPKKPAAAKKPAAGKAPAKKPAQTLSKKAKDHLKAKQAEVDAAQVDAEHNSRLDLREKIKGYFGELRDLRKAITEMTGKMGSRVKTILQVEDWNRGAHADIQKILGMSEAKRADYLRTFDPLYRVLYEEEWKSELHDLLTQIEAESNPEANLSDDDEVDAEFKPVDVLAETAPAEPEKGKKEKAEPVDPEIAEETEAFEADAAELEAQLAED